MDFKSFITVLRVFSMNQNMKIPKPNVCQGLYTKEYGQNQSRNSLQKWNGA